MQSFQWPFNIFISGENVNFHIFLNQMIKLTSVCVFKVTLFVPSTHKKTLMFGLNTVKETKSWKRPNTHQVSSLKIQKWLSDRNHQTELTASFISAAVCSGRPVGPQALYWTLNVKTGSVHSEGFSLCVLWRLRGKSPTVRLTVNTSQPLIFQR